MPFDVFPIAGFPAALPVLLFLPQFPAIVLPTDPCRLPAGAPAPEADPCNPESFLPNAVHSFWLPSTEPSLFPAFDPLLPDLHPSDLLSLFLQAAFAPPVLSGVCFSRKEVLLFPSFSVPEFLTVPAVLLPLSFESGMPVPFWQAYTGYNACIHSGFFSHLKKPGLKDPDCPESHPSFPSHRP